MDKYRIVERTRFGASNEFVVQQLYSTETDGRKKPSFQWKDVDEAPTLGAARAKIEKRMFKPTETIVWEQGE